MNSLRNIVGYVLYITLLFHVGRNITEFYYVWVFFAAFAFVATYKLPNLNFVSPLFISVVALYYIFPLITSFSYQMYGDPMIGMFRLYPSVLAILIGLYFSDRDVKNPVLVFVFFYCFAAFSLLWQYIYGPIPFLAEPSERAGGERYSSLVGSLTAYGGLVGVATLATCYGLKGYSRVLAVAMLTFGALLSLQKAALVGIALATFLSIYSGLVTFKFTLIGILRFLLILMVVYLVLISFDYSFLEQPLNYLEGVLKSDQELTSDTNILDSLYERLVTLPYDAIDYFGFDKLIFGTGVYGGSGGLGYPDLPMAHNGFVENLIISGIIGLFLDFSIILLFFCAVFVLFQRKYLSREMAFLSSGLIIWIPNYLFSGGGLFQPVSSLVFWLLFFRFYYLFKINRVGMMYA